MVIFLQGSTGAWYTDSKIKRLDIFFYWKCRFLSHNVILAWVQYDNLIVSDYLSRDHRFKP